MRYLVPIGRVLFSLIFVTTIFSHFSGATIDYASAQGVPLATLLVPLSGIVAMVGGLSVLLGYRARFGALLIVLFLVPVTLVMHKFWGLPDPQMAMMQKVNFMKNMSLVGAALMIVYNGAGPVSFDS
jgi:putative oxidoreductase